jgi:hypothetical protein
MSLAARLDEGEPGAAAVAGAAAAALDALASAARRIEMAAIAESAPQLAKEVVTRLTEATQAAEELAGQQVAVGLICQERYAAGYAAGAASRHLRVAR